jgi:hypothetical protein
MMKLPIWLFEVFYHLHPTWPRLSEQSENGLSYLRFNIPKSLGIDQLLMSIQAFLVTCTNSRLAPKAIDLL